MTLISALCTKGMREAGILGLYDVITPTQLTECVDRLQSLFRSFFGNELGVQLSPITYGYTSTSNTYAIASDDSQFIDSLFVPSNSRLIVNISAPHTIYLDPKPMDGARLGLIDNGNNLATYNITLNGNNQLINNAVTSVISTNGANLEWFYRADLGSWQPVVNFAATDQSPLPAEFDDLLSTALAYRINPAYGAATSQEMNNILTRMKRNFCARYHQTMEQHSETGLIRLPSNHFWKYVNSGTAFNRGKLA